MRAEETALHEEVVNRCYIDLQNLADPPEPDWAEYSNNPMARAKAYDAWLASRDRTFDKKQKAYNTMLKASQHKSRINNLESATRIQVEHIDSSKSLDEQFNNLLLDVESKEVPKGEIVQKKQI